MSQSLLSQTDLIIFFGTLAVVMVAGLFAGRREKDSSDYFLAGKGASWWGVAGSIFGSNVSANHMIGMMGVGFAAGFAQSHFEITAIAGLLMLCYILLPVYRKLNIYTLSEYLNRRYDDRARLAYAAVMLVIIVFVMTVPAFYAGSRSVNFLIQGDTGQAAQAKVVTLDGKVSGIHILNAGRGYRSVPKVTYGAKGAPAPFDKFEVTLADGTIAAVVINEPGLGYSAESPPTVSLQAPSGTGASFYPVIEGGKLVSVEIVDGGAGYSLDTRPELLVTPPDGENGVPATGFVTVVDGGIRKVGIAGEGSSPAVLEAGALSIKGGGAAPALNPGDINRRNYIIGIIAMALIAGTYTVVGGLKAVIFTDVIQSILMLIAGILLAAFMFNAIGGWSELRARDLAVNGGVERFHLYFATDHPKLPWTGVLSGLMVLHFYYWGANQFIVQRALAAKSDKEARVGIVSAGFFKLLIPFFSIGCGIAAWYYYADRAKVVPQDMVFMQLLADLVAPVGWGLVGIIAAGVCGAILSSIDSMLNSGATIITFDFYKRFINPNATEKQLVDTGKKFVVLLLILATGIAIWRTDPNSNDSFFLTIANHQSKLIAGVVVAFFLGMLWKRATATGAFVAIIAGVAISYSVEHVYNAYATPGLISVFGEKLNFMHAVLVSAVLSLLLHIGVSLATQPDKEKGRLTWVGLGIFSKQEFSYFVAKLVGCILFYAFLAALMVNGFMAPVSAASLAAGATWLVFLDNVAKMMLKAAGKGRAYNLLKEDRFWGGLLAACAVFMMFYFK